MDNKEYKKEFSPLNEMRDFKAYALDINRDEVPVSLTSSPLRDSAGFVKGTVLVAKDLRQLQRYAEDRLTKITPVLHRVSVGDFSERIIIPEKKDEFTEHLMALNLMINDFKQLNDAKSQFVAVAAHQLRTPLSGIKWAHKMLLSGDFGVLNDKQREVMEKGDITVEKLIRIVTDLLNVARIESGDFNYKKSPVDLTKFLEEIRDSSIDLARKKDITLDFDIPEKESVYLNIDELYFKMAITNIVNNAIMYSLSGGKVSVSFIKNDEMIELSVKDTGIGIREEEIPMLFKKFFRSPRAISMNTEGTGLGLYIVKSIIDGHNGKIKIESKEEKGATFFITVPLSK